MHAVGLAVAALPGIALGDGQHDLLALEPQRDLVLVDALDQIAIDLAADLGEDVRRAAAVEQQRLVALRHDPDDPQRHLAAGRARGRARGRAHMRWFRGLVAARGRACDRQHQGRSQGTCDETHGAEACNPRSGEPGREAAASTENHVVPRRAVVVCSHQQGRPWHMHTPPIFVENEPAFSGHYRRGRGRASSVADPEGRPSSNRSRR
jgi:hypothetical protein